MGTLDQRRFDSGGCRSRSSLPLCLNGGRKGNKEDHKASSPTLQRTRKNIPSGKKSRKKSSSQWVLYQQPTTERQEQGKMTGLLKLFVLLKLLLSDGSRSRRLMVSATSQGTIHSLSTYDRKRQLRPSQIYPSHLKRKSKRHVHQTLS